MLIYRKIKTDIIIPIIKTINEPATPPIITGVLLHEVLGKTVVPVPNSKTF